MYLQIFNLIKDLVFIHDSEYKIVFANDAYLSFCEKKFEEVVGHPYYEILPVRDGPLESCLKSLKSEDLSEHSEILMLNEQPFLSRSIRTQLPNFSLPISIHILENLKFLPQNREISEGLLLNTFVKDRHSSYLFSYQEYNRTISQLNGILDTIPDLIWLKNSEGIFLACNPTFERLLNLTEKDIVGKTDYDFVDKELADFFREKDRLAIEANGPSRNEEWLTFADNGYHGLFETVKTPLYDDAHNLIGILGIARDITELKNKENRYRVLFERNGTCTAIIEADGTISLANEQFAELAECSKESVIGTSFLNFVDDMDKEQMKTYHLRRSFDEMIPDQYEFNFVSAKGQKGIGSVTAVYLPETGQTIASMIDITEQNKDKMHIQRLTQMYATLSQCNQVIIHALNPQELFEQICRYAVTLGGMSMAWIGVIDTQTQMIRLKASYGDINHYLDEIEISTREDDLFGQGPTSAAVREERSVWCQDFMHDSSTAPWQEKVKAMGVQASASIPFYQNGKVIGAFILYSTTLNAFDTLSQKLIQEMTTELSFAMDNFDRESKRKASQNRLIKTEKLLENMSAMAHVGAWEFNPKTGEGEWTAEVSRIHDMDPNDSTSLKRGLSVYHGEWLEKIKSAIDLAVNQGIPYDLELQMVTPKGNKKWVRTIGTPIVESGEVLSVRGSMQDVTAQKTAQDQAKWLAHFDALTGLPNRLLLTDRAQHAISIANRTDTSLAVMLLDLDHFKNINDTLGHAVGDTLLVEIASRMKLITRYGDTLSRQGGDEFVILLPGADLDGAIHFAEKVTHSISQVYQIEDHNLTVTPSIGIAIYPMDGKNFQNLFQAADVAMYRAKHDGRNCYRFYASELQTSAARNLQIENALRQAIENKELEVYYQPQIDAMTQKLVGCEALLRWKHPILGMVSPAEFIPIAESSGQIIAIGEWVLRTALEQLKIWLDNGMESFLMAINLSAVQFRHPKLISLVLSVLQESGIASEYLELELTESITMQDPMDAIAIMNELHSHGIRMSIDDFGTGYSSLSYLKKFSVYKLKIDQSFIRDINENLDDRNIVKTIISMAHNLNMVTIAEGVETRDQLEFLQQNGCDEIQGYYFSKPIPSNEFEVFVKQHAIKC
ncbi:MAG: EAL domain-containing protein [Thiovulaceae bacterium]|nr:EAL domain-containing protein [Sulfurimonadaceae bacterium]